MRYFIFTKQHSFLIFMFPLITTKFNRKYRKIILYLRVTSFNYNFFFCQIFILIFLSTSILAVAECAFLVLINHIYFRPWQIKIFHSQFGDPLKTVQVKKEKNKNKKQKWRTEKVQIYITTMYTFRIFRFSSISSNFIFFCF